MLAHSLGALGIQIQAARSVLTDRADIDRAGELLAAAQRMAAEGLAETRRAVHALRTDTAAAERGAGPGHRHLRGSATGWRSASTTGGGPRPLPPDATIALLRIAQEALVNAAKHAAGQPSTVRLDYGDADVRLTVSNPLARQPRTAGTAVSTVNGGYGLTGMRERLRMLNGTLEAGRRDGQWIVTARLPRAASLASMTRDAAAGRRRCASSSPTTRPACARAWCCCWAGCPTSRWSARPRTASRPWSWSPSTSPTRSCSTCTCRCSTASAPPGAWSAEHPGVAVVVLTTYADDGSVLDALQAGARSYLTKDADRIDIARALHAAAGGLAVFDPRVQATLLAAAPARAGAGRRPTPARPAATAAGRPDPARGRDPGPDRPRA